MKAVLFGKFEFKQSRYVEDRNMQNTFYGVDVRVYSTEIVARIGTGSDFFFFLTAVLSRWDFSYGKIWLLSPGKASCDRVALPNPRCMLGVLVFP